MNQMAFSISRPGSGTAPLLDYIGQSWQLPRWLGYMMEAVVLRIEGGSCGGSVAASADVDAGAAHGLRGGGGRVFTQEATDLITPPAPDGSTPVFPLAPLAACMLGSQRLG